LTADNRGALRELEGLEKLVEFVGNKVCSVYNNYYLPFSNSLVTPKEKTKEITTVMVVWIPDLN